MDALNNLKIEPKDILKISIKYIIEGLVMVIVAFYIPTLYKTSLRKPTLQEIFTLGLVAALSMMVLDYVSDRAALGARFGAGFTIGRNLVNL
jgi:hypothetical protein